LQFHPADVPLILLDAPALRNPLLRAEQQVYFPVTAHIE